MNVFGIIPAAGIGARFGADRPKQYLMLADKPLLQHSLESVMATGLISKMYVAIREDDKYWSGVQAELSHPVVCVEGGSERAESVLNAICAIPNAAKDDWVLVHDAVRPLLDAQLVKDFLVSLKSDDVGAIMALPIYDTVKQAEKQADHNHCIAKTLDRSLLWAAQTPQVFRYGLLREALETTLGNASITDEASAMEACGHKVKLYEGHRYNIKITRQEDLQMAEHIIRTQGL